MSPRLKRNSFITIFLLPTFIFFYLFTLYPIIKGIQISFFDWSGRTKDMDFVGLNNFLELLTDPIIWTAIKNDYFLVVGKVFGIMLLATIFAVSVTRLKVVGRNLFRVLFFIPNVISVVVIGVLFRYIYSPNLGFINSFLSLFTDTPVQISWLGQENLAMW